MTNPFNFRLAILWGKIDFDYCRIPLLGSSWYKGERLTLWITFLNYVVGISLVHKKIYKFWKGNRSKYLNSYKKLCQTKSLKRK